MSDGPYTPDYGATPGAGFSRPAIIKTSGFAIASLVCGAASLVMFCALVPGILGIVFGAVAIGQDRRGEARGRGLAIAGIVTGSVGLLAGVILWIVMVRSPDAVPIPGREVSAVDRSTLEQMGVVQPNEEIKMLYSDGFVSLEETGVVITADRLLTYYDGGNIESCALADIRAIDFTQGQSWLDYGQFLVETDDGDLIVFEVGTSESGDQTFHRMLQQRVSEARAAANKPPVETEVSAMDDYDVTD